MPAPKPVQSVLNTIGNTPVVQLRKLVPEGAADVFVKLEYFNPTGSYKDRMALAMIEGAEQRGTLKPGMRVRVCRRQHGIVAGDGVRRQRISLHSGFLRRLRGPKSC